MKFDIFLYVHGASSTSGEEEILFKGLINYVNVGRTFNGKCLCNYAKSNFFERPKIAIVHSLNDSYNPEETIKCNKSVKGFILGNPQTNFLLMDYGGGDRERIIGSFDNLHYINEKNGHLIHFLKRFEVLR